VSSKLPDAAGLIRVAVPLAVAAVLLAGVCAAANIGKLPPALPALRQDFGLTLVEASWLVSAFQVAGLSLGVFGGLLADRFGPRRTMACGLLLLALASSVGAAAQGATLLLAMRVVESAGFMLSVLPGPALLRRFVAPGSLSPVLGLWSCYMPTGMSLMMIATPPLLEAQGWRAAWVVCAALPAAACLAVLRALRPDGARPPGAQSAAALARLTLATPGAWLLALCFGLYAGQFITVFSFLPTLYQAAGIPAGTAGLLSAAGVAANLIGNLVAGVLLGRGANRGRLIGIASVVMAGCAIAALSLPLPFAAGYGAVLLLSAAGGLIPGTLFATAPGIAPHGGAVATTTGLMQQGSCVGQFLLPPLAAAAASGRGGWAAAGVVIAGCAVLNVFVAAGVARAARGRRG
jgi:CP family cyanate transporter-like MFS transporter